MDKFGLLEERRYPMDTVAQLETAIKFFSTIREELKGKIANKIAERCESLGVTINVNDTWFAYTDRYKKDNDLIYDLDADYLQPSEIEPTLAKYVLDDKKFKILDKEEYFEIMEKYRVSVAEGFLGDEIKTELGKLFGKLRKIESIPKEEASILTAHRSEENKMEAFYMKPKPGLSKEELDEIKAESEKLKKQCRSGELIPVYIILSGSDWLFSKIIRTVTVSRYSHSTISLFPELNPIVGFCFNGRNDGIQFEDPIRFLDLRNPKFIKIFAFFIPIKSFDKINDQLNYMRQNPSKYHYNKKVYNVVLNKSNAEEKSKVNFNLDLFCSEFLSWLFAKVGISLIDGKPADLVTPKDISNLLKGKLAVAYEGLMSDFKMDKIIHFEKNLGVNKDKYRRKYHEAEMIESATRVTTCINDNDFISLESVLKTPGYGLLDKTVKVFLENPSNYELNKLIETCTNNDDVNSLRFIHEVIKRTELRESYNHSLVNLVDRITTYNVDDIDVKTESTYSKFLIDCGF
jgi:hypothetical protein